jgi:hypothetical protein
MSHRCLRIVFANLKKVLLHLNVFASLSLFSIHLFNVHLALGVRAYPHDAAPAHRTRFYFMNWEPFNTPSPPFNVREAASYLEDGARLCDDGDKASCITTGVVGLGTREFEGEKNGKRYNRVYRKNNKGIEFVSMMNAREAEAMMGFPGVRCCFFLFVIFWNLK